MPGGIKQGAVRANGFEVEFLECGSGPLALCLHGFPDSAHTWRHLLPALAGAGFRAVAAFQRGYAPSAVPKDGRYQTGVLALDARYVDPALADVQAATQAVPAQPTLYLHGADDGTIGVEVAEAARPMVGENVSIEIIAGAGHFLHLEQPEIVNRRILEFLTE